MPRPENVPLDEPVTGEHPSDGALFAGAGAYVVMHAFGSGGAAVPPRS